MDRADVRRTVAGTPRSGARRRIRLLQSHPLCRRGAVPDRGTGVVLAERVAVSEVFHYAGGPFNNSGKNPRVSGRDPQGRTYHTFASFEDPDGNSWLLQEIQTRLPGREWKSKQARSADVASLAELLHETSEHHDHYEKTHAEHHWWDWYAPYLSARQNGSSREEAVAAADRYMDEILQVLPR